ncbi:MAG: hypothetical protein JXM73_22565 [Anaerolineae bacterium]|nr:hypothetical protein [Anaerolineae bacterium]
MSVKRILLVVLVVGTVLLAVGLGPSGASMAQAWPLSSQAAGGDGTLPYAGTLADAAGQPVADGLYDFSFALYAAESGGKPLWSEVQSDVVVAGGAFELALGRVTAIPAAALDSGGRWLAVGVRGPGEAGFTPLLPRQRLNAASPAAPDAPTAGAACPHDHVGEEWYADIAWSNGAFKVYNYGNGPSIWGWNGGNGNGLRGYATGTGLGVYGESQSSTGVVGRSTDGRGVEGYSTNGYGIYANSTNSDSIRVDGAGGNGIYVGSSGDHGVYVHSAGWSGVSVWSAAVAGMWVASAGQDGVLVSTAGWDGVHVVGPVGGVYYGSGKKGDEDFAVLNTGEVRSKVGFAAPTNDFAVTMPLVGDEAAYEPGDVLVVSASGSGAAERASAGYSPAVVGVYSAAPAFVGGRSVTGDAQAGGLPVTILGVVSCKVSAENGPIRPGDLLVTSATPGHAMRADRESALPGTILGKALEAWDSGTGLIQVLVTLQ